MMIIAFNQRILEAVKRNGFLTGSSAWLPQYHDQDFVVCFSDIEKILAEENVLCYVVNYIDTLEDDINNFTCLKMDAPKVSPFSWIDIILVSEKSYNIWRRATRAMSKMVASSSEFSDLIREKNNRVEVFEMLKKFYIEKDKK